MTQRRRFCVLRVVCCCTAIALAAAGCDAPRQPTGAPSSAPTPAGATASREAAFAPIETPSSAATPGGDTTATAAELSNALTAAPGDLERLPIPVRAAIRDTAEMLKKAPGNESLLGVLGGLYWVYGFPDNAIACFETAALAAPKHHGWPYMIGVVYDEKGDAQKAEAYYKKAMELNSEYPMTPIRLAELYAKTDRAKAAEVYKRMLQRQADFPFALSGLGKLAAADGKLDEAISRYQEAMKALPNCAAFHREIAELYRKAGDEARARRHEIVARRAAPYRADDSIANELKLVGMDLDAMIVMAVAAARNPESSDKMIMTAQRIDTKGDKVRRAMATIKMLQGKPAEALTIMQSLLDADPKNAALWFECADLHARMGKPAEAVAAYRKGLEIEPDDTRARTLMAAQMMRAGDREGAKKELEQAIRDDAAYDGPYLTLSELAMAGGDRIECERVLRLCLTQAPESTLAMNSLAWILATSPNAAQRNPQEAVELAEKAVARTRRKVHEFLDTLACALAAAGRFEDAVKVTQEALVATEGADPKFVNLYRDRVRLWRQQKPHIEQ